MISNARIMVVDDLEEELQELMEALESVTDQPVTGIRKSRMAPDLLRGGAYDLLVTDLRMPAPDGLDLLRVAHGVDPDLPVVILTGYPSLETAVEALKQGAADYLTKPVNLEELTLTAKRLLNQRRIQGEHRLLQRQVERPYAFQAMVGDSPGITTARKVIRRVAEAGLDCLITGETGTGKELVARSLHALSPGAEGRFVPVDCGAIPEALLESEFFGHERGAFSGADRRSVGLMEFADGGTLFLDELGSLPAHLQAKLLRALQERSFRRVGASQEISVAFRVVAATNSSPEALLAEGRLREDLYFRLNVGRVELPPLRDRGRDVAALLEHFNARFSAEMGRPPMRVPPETLEILQAYPWPGNVRELQNLVRRELALLDDGVLSPEDLPEEMVLEAGRSREVKAAREGGFFRERTAFLEEFEERYLSNLLQAFRGDVTAASAHAGVPRGTFYRLLNKHGLTPREFRV
jgi:DNA-binding NtrC family response regulator